MTTRYAVGAWLALVAPRACALLPATTEADRADRLWAALAAQDGFDAVFGRLIEGNLADLPSFALAVLGPEDCRLAVRGPLRVTLETAQGEIRRDGRRVATWREDSVAGPVRLRLEAIDQPGGQELGLESGQVLAAWVELDPAEPTPDLAAPPARRAAEGADPSALAPSAPASSGSKPASSAPGSSATSSASSESAPGSTEEVSSESTPDRAPALSGSAPAPLTSSVPSASQPGSAAVVPSAPASPVPTLGASGSASSGSEPRVPASSESEPASSASQLGSAVPASVPPTFAYVPSAPALLVPGPTAVVSSVPGYPIAPVPVPPDPPPVPAEHSGQTTYLPLDDDSWSQAGGDGPGGYDRLFDPFDQPTRLSTTEAAGPGQPPPAPPPPATPVPPPPAAQTEDDWGDDHDGMTVASFSLAAPPPGSAVPPDAAVPFPGAVPSPGVAPFPGAAPSPYPSRQTAAAAAAPGQATVLARLCAACGRPNSTLRPQCAGCGQPLGGDARRIPRPVLGQLKLSTGELIPLDRPVVFGRRPKAARFSNADLPRLVAVNGPRQDISRSHFKIDLDEWSVLASDAGSTNGTVLRRAGQPDRRLRPGEQVVAQAGDLYDLGDGVTIKVVELA
ncbi:MAG: FHA domain-containing protein [Propionibacteriaceae bacterium]|jgi:hypothetical protein|nr:FHA domain-containing protein [Propionibacteriaceae bacterium]